MGGSAKEVEVHSKCIVTAQRFNPFHGSVIFSARCRSHKTSSSLCPVVRTPSANSRRQNGMEIPEAWIFTSKQFNRLEWIYERRLKYFVVVNKPRSTNQSKTYATECTSRPHWVKMSSSQYAVRCDHHIKGITKFCRPNKTVIWYYDKPKSIAPNLHKMEWTLSLYLRSILQTRWSFHLMVLTEFYFRSTKNQFVLLTKNQCMLFTVVS